MGQGWPLDLIEYCCEGEREEERNFPGGFEDGDHGGFDYDGPGEGGRQRASYGSATRGGVG